MTDRDTITRTRARTPGAEGYPPSKAVHCRALGPAQYGITDVGHEVHEGRRQTRRRSAHAGSRLKLIDVLGRSRLISQPSSRTGENPPYGMIGGSWKRRHHSKPGPRQDPTRLRGAESNLRPYRDHSPHHCRNMVGVVVSAGRVGRGDLRKQSGKQWKAAFRCRQIQLRDEVLQRDGKPYSGITNFIAKCCKEPGLVAKDGRCVAGGRSLRLLAVSIHVSYTLNFYWSCCKAAQRGKVGGAGRPESALRYFKSIGDRQPTSSSSRLRRSPFVIRRQQPTKPSLLVKNRPDAARPGARPAPGSTWRILK
jgi:hypothetical protein